MEPTGWTLPLTNEEADELEQLLLYTIYPEAYDETPINKRIIFEVLDRVSERKP